MTIELVPQLGIAVPDDLQYVDLRDRAIAACTSANILQKHGADYGEPDDYDKDIAAALAEAYTRDHEGTSKKITTGKAEQMSTPALMLVGNILDAFGKAVVENSIQLRNMITNKLIIETENPDPRVRIRALELLGKISDVGLFTDKREVTITTKSSDELRETLRSKLAKLVPQDQEEIEDAVYIENDR
ncbi:MAG: hypothetical protein RLZZ602_1623 [Pseudomonadota bacterium]|jgi:hypothetical protein